MSAYLDILAFGIVGIAVMFLGLRLKAVFSPEKKSAKGGNCDKCKNR